MFNNRVIKVLICNFLFAFVFPVGKIKADIKPLRSGGSQVQTNGTAVASVITPGPKILSNQQISPGKKINVPSPSYSKYPWKIDITATVFWIGENPSINNPTPNHQSSWDTEWQKNYGGYDDPNPAARTNSYTPKAFVPGLNPFYVALPYNDVLNHKEHKTEAAKIIPWFQSCFTKAGRSVLRGAWIAIRFGNRVCYAQWEDCGPYCTDDYQYVFGNSKPKSQINNNAGIDLSPAVRDYLGIKSQQKCDWRFVDLREVPLGPWRGLGNNNPFVKYPQYFRPTSKLDDSKLNALLKAREAFFAN
jgi:hypothetical protein